MKYSNLYDDTVKWLKNTKLVQNWLFGISCFSGFVGYQPVNGNMLEKNTEHYVANKGLFIIAIITLGLYAAMRIYRYFGFRHKLKNSDIPVIERMVLCLNYDIRRSSLNSFFNCIGDERICELLLPEIIIDSIDYNNELYEIVIGCPSFRMFAPIDQVRIINYEVFDNCYSAMNQIRMREYSEREVEVLEQATKQLSCYGRGKLPLRYSHEIRDALGEDV